MKRRDPTIVIALIFALGTHLALMAFGVRAARQELGWWLQSPPAQAKSITPQPIPPPQNPIEQLGDHDTNGTSINSSPGTKPLQSAVAYAEQEQAAMQRDPAGFGGKGSNQQLDQTLRGDNGDNKPRQSQSPAQTAASVFGSRENAESQISPKSPEAPPIKTYTPGTTPPVDILSEGPMTAHPPESTNTPTPSEQQQQQQQQQQQNTQNSPAREQGVGGKPGAAEPGAGDPIPTSDFESYPVTHVASRFIAGKIEARPGRKMRMRELPRLGLAAYADLENMDKPYLVLVLKIDESGNVTDVKIEHSTGSENVDLPCQRAAFSWWFEPQKDPDTGKPHGEMMEFTIYFG